MKQARHVGLAELEAAMMGNAPLPAETPEGVDPLLALAASKLDELLASPWGFAELARVAAASELTRRRHDAERYRRTTVN